MVEGPGAIHHQLLLVAERLPARVGRGVARARAPPDGGAGVAAAAGPRRGGRRAARKSSPRRRRSQSKMSPRSPQAPPKQWKCSSSGLRRSTKLGVRVVVEGAAPQPAPAPYRPQRDPLGARDPQERVRPLDPRHPVAQGPRPPQRPSPPRVGRTHCRHRAPPRSVADGAPQVARAAGRPSVGSSSPRSSPSSAAMSRGAVVAASAGLGRAPATTWTKVRSARPARRRGRGPASPLTELVPLALVEAERLADGPDLRGVLLEQELDRRVRQHRLAVRALQEVAGALDDRHQRQPVLAGAAGDLLEEAAAPLGAAGGSSTRRRRASSRAAVAAPCASGAAARRSRR